MCIFAARQSRAVRRLTACLTQCVAVRQDCAGRSLCPAEARSCSQMLTSRSPAGCCPNNCAAQRRYLRRLAQSAPPQPPKINFARDCPLEATLTTDTFIMFPPFVTQKVEPKCAAVKRFRGRPCAYAESDAYGTFEAIKSSPILYAPSRDRPLSEIASAAGKADACEYCGSSELRRSSPPHAANRSPRTQGNNKNSMQIVVGFNYLYYC